MDLPPRRVPVRRGVFPPDLAGRRRGRVRLGALRTDRRRLHVRTRSYAVAITRMAITHQREPQPRHSIQDHGNGDSASHKGYSPQIELPHRRRTREPGRLVLPDRAAEIALILLIPTGVPRVIVGGHGAPVEMGMKMDTFRPYVTAHDDHYPAQISR